MVLFECNRGTCAGLREPDHIHAVEIASLPIWDTGRIATVIREKKASQSRDVVVLPRNDNKSALVLREFKFLPQSVDIGNADARIDR